MGSDFINLFSYKHHNMKFHDYLMPVIKAYSVSPILEGCFSDHELIRMNLGA